METLRQSGIDALASLDEGQGFGCGITDAARARLATFGRDVLLDVARGASDGGEFATFCEVMSPSQAVLLCANTDFIRSWKEGVSRVTSRGDGIHSQNHAATSAHLWRAVARTADLVREAWVASGGRTAGAPDQAVLAAMALFARAFGPLSPEESVAIQASHAEALYPDGGTPVASARVDAVVRAFVAAPPTDLRTPLRPEDLRAFTASLAERRPQAIGFSGLPDRSSPIPGSTGGRQVWRRSGADRIVERDPFDGPAITKYVEGGGTFIAYVWNGAVLGQCMGEHPPSPPVLESILDAFRGCDPAAYAEKASAFAERMRDEGVDPYDLSAPLREVMLQASASPKP